MVEDNACPTYCRAIQVPYAIKEKIEKELKRLKDQGTINQVTFSEWAAPIVKKNQMVRYPCATTK